MDMMGKFTISASMLLTGFAIVFGVLFLLIFIIWLYGTIVSNAQNKVAQRKTDKELQKQKEIIKDKKPQANPPLVADKKVSSDSTVIPDEIAAVISAAVYTMYGSKQKVKIKSIKRRKTRSAWANAAILENNQPF